MGKLGVCVADIHMQYSYCWDHGSCHIYTRERVFGCVCMGGGGGGVMDHVTWEECPLFVYVLYGDLWRSHDSL